MEFYQAELLDQLGWGRSAKDYQRLERAFYTLAGARFDVRGWRDNGRKLFTSKGTFSLIGDFELRDSRKKNLDVKLNQPPRCDRVTSYFHFGHVLFESIQNGYIKKLDMELLRKLRSTAARRLFRYLDKHFYPPKRTRLAIDLKELAITRIGIRKNADTHAIKEILIPAISELEQIGFIKQEPWLIRCQKIRRAEYKIHFELAENRPDLPKFKGQSRRTRNRTGSNDVDPFDVQFRSFLKTWMLMTFDERLAYERSAVRSTDKMKRDGYLRFAKSLDETTEWTQINAKGSPSVLAFLCYRERILYEHHTRK